MRRALHISLVMLAALCLSACIKDVPEQMLPQDMVRVTLGASVGAPATRTVLSDDGHVHWRPDDAISIYFSTGTGYALDADIMESQACTSFSGYVPSANAGSMDGALCLYPAGHGSYIKTSSPYIITRLDAVQTAVAGSFADTTLVSIGKVKDGFVQFHHLCSGLAFTVDHPGIESVTMRACSAEYLSGSFRTRIDNSGNAVITAYNSGSAEVTLRAEQGSSLVPGEWYYLASLPFDDVQGVELSFISGDHIAKREIARSVSFMAGKWLRVRHLDAGVSFGHVPVLEPSLSKAEISSAGDTLSISVQATVLPAVTFPSWVSKVSETGSLQPGEEVMSVDYVFAVSANESDAIRRDSICFSTSEGLEAAVALNCRYGYESQDYSADGQVVVIQEATRGRGIDIVLMGDAFSDREIASGRYGQLMRQAADELFVDEPMASYRDCFNISYVNVVSRNEGYGELFETALGTRFLLGTTVSGNHVAVLRYLRDVPLSQGRENQVAIVLMNRDFYSGTCYPDPFDDLRMYRDHYDDEEGSGDAGDGSDPESGSESGSGEAQELPYQAGVGTGFAISYLPLGTALHPPGPLVRHEVVGHAFAKLGDEYGSYGTIPEENVGYFERTYAHYGWWKNIDFTSDPTQVKWARFIADPRWEAAGIGVYPGGFSYLHGVYHPTQVSLMLESAGQFNAPSAEAIYYRINRLAFGDGWEYDYEAFVSLMLPEPPLPPELP